MRYALLGVVFLVVLTGLITIGIHTDHSGASSACVSTATEQCPSEDFHRGYRRWSILRDKLAKSQGSETVSTREQWTDEFEGLTNRLNRALGQGKIYNEQKDRIVSVPVPVPATK